MAGIVAVILVLGGLLAIGLVLERQERAWQEHIATCEVCSK